MRVDPETAPARLPFGDRIYMFCSLACARTFAQKPEAYHHE
jgi:YHS domain-containing protein